MDPAVKKLNEHLHRQLVFGRRPLLVLGAGASMGAVPLLSEMGRWFEAQLKVLPRGEEVVKAIAAAAALGAETKDLSRRQVAELFATLQRKAEPWEGIWADFSLRFLATGLWGTEGAKGVLGVEPTATHLAVADGVRDLGCQVISLNFDGLTWKALRSQPDVPGGALLLHDAREVDTYFTADADESIPVVFKVRGDVFFATCSDTQCPASSTPQPIWRVDDLDAETLLRCGVCLRGDLRLGFSFPGYRAKEEAAFPMLWSIRRYLAASTSSIILVGVSGRWDRYLLEFLFDWSVERDTPLIDVNPTPNNERLIEAFRSLHFPMVPRLTEPVGDWKSSVHFIKANAEDVMADLLR